MPFSAHLPLWSLLVLPGLIALATARADKPTPLPVLTTIAEVRRLSAEEARRGYPVRAEGIVTLGVPGMGLLFVQDETGGIFVSPSRLPRELRGLPAGTPVQVKGETTFGRFSPSIRGRGEEPVDLVVLGRATVPEPLQLSVDQLADPRYHNQWIEVSGVVRSVTRELMYGDRHECVVITLGSTTARAATIVFRRVGKELPESWGGATVRVRGVFAAIFNHRGQFVGMRLAVEDLKDFQIDQPARAAPFDLPLRPLSSLMQFDVSQAGGARVRVAGVVTLVVSPRGFYLQNEDVGVWVKTVEPPTVVVGDRLEVAAFPALGDWSPILEDALCRRTGEAPLPEARTVTAHEALSGEYDGLRVTIEGTLLETSQQPGATTLLVKADEQVFAARTASPDTSPAGMPDGSALRLTGICVNARDPASVRQAISVMRAAPPPTGFELLVSGPGDVAVLRRPSWWTPPRIAAALGIVSLAAIAAFLWAFALRRRVAAQTEVIRTQLSREAVYEERTRIARELHDTLEQELAGIALQLDTASAKLAADPVQAQRTLDTARSLLRHSRTEARRAIHDLRASLLEGGTLSGALANVAAQVQDGGTIEAALQVAGPPRPLAGRVEANLLRIAQEAVANAVKHAAPRRIELALTYEAQRVSLAVRDDGAGFALESVSSADGRFGLRGMRERAERIHGRLSVESVPGRGTCVQVTVETEPQTERHP